MYLKEQLSPCLFPEIFYQQIQKLPRKGILPFFQVTLSQHRSRIMKIALRQMVVHSKRFHILDDIQKITVSTIASKYRKGEKITECTAYTYPEVGFSVDCNHRLFGWNKLEWI